MFFNKKETPKKKNNIKFATSFKKEKLSVEALDHFAEAYAIDADNPDDPASPYVLKNGNQISIDSFKVTQNPNNIALQHFEYLLGQTLPYHQENPMYYTKDLLFILNRDGKPIPWTNDKKAFVQFLQMADEYGYIMPINSSKSDPKNPILGKADVKPVIHSEKEHPAPGEE